MKNVTISKTLLANIKLTYTMEAFYYYTKMVDYEINAAIKDVTYCNQ